MFRQWARMAPQALSSSRTHWPAPICGPRFRGGARFQRRPVRRALVGKAAGLVADGTKAAPRMPIPLRNDENHVCARAAQPPRVPEGRSVTGHRSPTARQRAPYAAGCVRAAQGNRMTGCSTNPPLAWCQLGRLANPANTQAILSRRVTGSAVSGTYLTKTLPLDPRGV